MRGLNSKNHLEGMERQELCRQISANIIPVYRVAYLKGVAGMVLCLCFETLGSKLISQPFPFRTGRLPCTRLYCSSTCHLAIPYADLKNLEGC